MNGQTPIESKSGTKRSRAKPATEAKVPMLADEHVQIVRSTLSAAAVHPPREQLIAEAAYRRAEARSFEPGHEMDDWIAAEAEVDARLQGEGRAY